MIAVLLVCLPGCRDKNDTDSETVTDVTEGITVTEVTENAAEETAASVTEVTVTETEELTTAETADYSGIECCRITEYTTKNNIFFSYPQIDSSCSNSEEINQLIYDYVNSYISPMYNGEYDPELMEDCDNPEMWDYNETVHNLEDGGLLLEMDYKIQRMDSMYMSVSFEGSFYVKGCAHPNAAFISVVVDAQNCCVVEMSDLYNVDSEFADVISKNYEEQADEAFIRRTGVSSLELSEDLKILSAEKVINAFTSDDSRNWVHSLNWFVTDTDIGIVVIHPHAVGDYVVIYVSCDELEPFKT